jgi:hypothetical protein
MDNPEKPATSDTQYQDKQNKNTTQYVLDTTICKQTHLTYIRYEPSYKQLEIKTNRTSLLCAFITILHVQIELFVHITIPVQLHDILFLRSFPSCNIAERLVINTLFKLKPPKWALGCLTLIDCF